MSYEYYDEATFQDSLRIPGILKVFNLESRFAKPEDEFKINSPLEIDFSTRDKILPLERQKAFDFLSNALGVPMK